MSLLRQMKIQDGDLSTLTATVNSSRELTVNDASLTTLTTAGNLTLTDIETAVESADGSQKELVSVIKDVLEELKLHRLHLEYITKMDYTDKDLND